MLIVFCSTVGRYWLSVGAQPSDIVRRLLYKAGILPPPPIPHMHKKGPKVWAPNAYVWAFSLDKMTWGSATWNVQSNRGARRLAQRWWLLGFHRTLICPRFWNTGSDTSYSLKHIQSRGWLSDRYRNLNFLAFEAHCNANATSVLEVECAAGRIAWIEGSCLRSLILAASSISRFFSIVSFMLIADEVMGLQLSVVFWCSTNQSLFVTLQFLQSFWDAEKCLAWLVWD